MGGGHQSPLKSLGFFCPPVGSGLRDLASKVEQHYPGSIEEKGQAGGQEPPEEEGSYTGPGGQLWRLDWLRAAGEEWVDLRGTGSGVDKLWGLNG